MLKSTRIDNTPFYKSVKQIHSYVAKYTSSYYNKYIIYNFSLYRNESLNIFKEYVHCTRQKCSKQQCAIEWFFFVCTNHGETPKKLPLPSLKKQKYSQKRAKSVFICSHYNTVYTIGGAENAIKHADIKVNTKSCAHNRDTRAKISKHFSQSFPQLFLRHFCLFFLLGTEHSYNMVPCVQAIAIREGVLCGVLCGIGFFVT